MLEESGTDGVLNFVMREQHITQREAGPHRSAEHVWTWHGVQYQYESVTYDQTTYLIHRVRDADRLLYARDFEEAIKLYREALYENEVDPEILNATPAATATAYPDLIPWGGIFAKEESRNDEIRMLDAYARYRLVLAYTAIRDSRADVILSEMTPWNLDDVSSYYTLLAGSYRDSYREAVTTGLADTALSTACQAVLATAASWPRTYEYLGDRDYFGPALSNYSIEDLCPF
jgi:hypothetical protein